MSNEDSPEREAKITGQIVRGTPGEPGFISAEIVAHDTLSDNGQNTVNKYQTSGLMPPWKPGQSENPGGRPKKVTSALDQEATPDKLAQAANSLIDRAIRGSERAFEIMRDTLDGKPRSDEPDKGELNIIIWLRTPFWTPDALILSESNDSKLFVVPESDHCPCRIMSFPN